MRENLPESLALFDGADPNMVMGERANTTVPAQALFLMNNPFVLKQADAAATHIAARHGADVTPEPFRAHLHALLLTGGEPLTLGAGPAEKIPGRHLGPYLTTLTAPPV